ncbi:hypothetical protein [Streptomyces phaeochromogenes]|uniref:Protein kilB n=1 Tax=Streptomyces phaeochromogenes TaxID=1923 RepID=A0ABZ1HEQ8_STRPH|nr:hypothetical protein [Streptomyces phaeochromogenes]WRZ30437.1 hypothetical protein OG931_23150 [Streptomyces phaeochromogenes]WSD16037.1 hypothetical protein OHB35_23845 [Streptomyces phaeochromogenes]
MTTAIVAVIGTLLGAVTAGVMQHLTTVAARRDRDRQALAAAVAALLGAATDHRRHQYLKHVMRRQSHEETMEIRAARYEARSEMTKALTSLTLVTDDASLLGLADTLVQRSTDMGEPPHDDYDAVNAAGDRAREAHAAFQAAAAEHLRRARS